MKHLIAAWLTLILCAPWQHSWAATTWTEGREYVLIAPIQRTSVPPGKVEVMEVFSYGCIACNSFQPIIEKLKSGLPANAEMVYLPASFIPSENWVMLQRAYLTAQALGIADRTHQSSSMRFGNPANWPSASPRSPRSRTPPAATRA